MKSDKVLKDIALLTVRIGLGSSIAAHGAQKMFGLFDGPGMKGTTAFMGSLGFQPARSYAQASSATEITAGLLIAVGALGPVGPALLASVMVVAAETVHRPNGYFQGENGFELNALYSMAAVLLANEGHGSISVDRILGLDRRMTPTLGWIVLAAGVAGACTILAQRRIAPPAPPTIRVHTGTTEGAQTGA